MRPFFLLREDQTFLDIGANIGFYSHILARKCKIVHAWEPNPSTAKILEKNSERFSNVSVHIEALGNLETVLPFYLHSEPGHDGLIKGKNVGTYIGKTIEVKVRKLDSYDFSFEHIGLIEIDVEGYEVEVIKGGLKTIAEHKPRLIIDVHDKENLSRIMNLLPEFRWLGVKDINGLGWAHLVGFHSDLLI